MTADNRPPIRLILRNTDGDLELIGSRPFGLFESLPVVGDVVVLPSPVGDEQRALVVHQRYFSASADEPAWWLVLEPASANEWLELGLLDRDLAVMERERAGEVSESLQKLTVKKRRERPVSSNSSEGQ